MLVFGIIVELKCKKTKRKKNKELVVSMKHQHHFSFNKA